MTLEEIVDSGKKFKLIYADCPWNFKTYSDKGELKAPQKHYSTMTVDDLKKLPIKDIADKDSILLQWVYQPLLPEAIAVMEAWGYEYKTIALMWRKLTKHGKEHMSTGYYTRAGGEICLLGRRGNPPRPKVRNIRQVFSSSVREHSRKPDEVYDFIEAMYDPEYLELFSRGSPRPGWVMHGNEVGKY